MAQQIIDIGAAPNDGTGDPFRDAFDKCNDNFTELYAGLVGLLDFKGSTDCSANPNYPAASKGDFYVVSVAGKIGGASGVTVEVGDAYFALADNAGGTQAGVGTSWTVIQGNIVGSSITELDDIPDVNAPTPANGDVLTWDSTPGEWVPQAPTGSGIAELDDIPDVNAPSPSNGDVLTWASTPGEWVSAAASGGGDFTFIARNTVTAANADIALPSGYDSFHIEFYFTVSTDNVELQARVTEDNFATVKSGASDYGYATLRHGSSTGLAQSNAAAQIQLSAAQGNAAGEYTAGFLNIVNAKETSPTMVLGTINYLTTASLFSGSHVVGDYHGTTNAVDGVRLLASSGTLTGFYKVWGRAV